MAKVKFGITVTDMRNKLGNVVYSRNRYGAYTREYVIPANTITTPRTQVRDTLSAVSTAWNALTQTQRNSWNAAVENWRHTDVFGDAIKPTGQTLYIKLNFSLYFLGYAELILPPAPSKVLASVITAASFSLVGTTMPLTFNPSPVAASHLNLVFATASMLTNKSYFRNKLQFITYIDAGNSSPYNAYADYVPIFGIPTLGSYIGIAIQSLNTSTGQKSPLSFGSCQVGI